MRSGLDFSSWQALLSTVLGLGVITLVMVGIRLLVMQTVQQRRERENRQINERLRTLIAAYKTLGGSFTGDLAVDPTHLRELRVSAERQSARAPDTGAPPTSELTALPSPAIELPGSDRRRRVRDAVEAALSDVILLGTEEQVRLAAQAATDLAAGRAVSTAAIVVSLRTFIREVLDLDPVPTALAIPQQGPVRPSAPGSRSAGRSDGSAERGDAKRGGGQGSGGGLGGSGPGSGGDPEDDPHR
jgi:heme exporter protein D